MTQGVIETSRGVQEDMVPMLVPLVRLFLRAGLGAGEFALASKLAFIRVAAESATIAHRLNVSAIAASTGLTRKEVRALLALLGSSGPVPRRDTSRQRTVRVLQGWITDPAFHDRDGAPLQLSMRGGEVSFEGLVRRFAGDVTPVSVFRELQRSGSVSRAKNGMIRLRKQSTRHRGYGSEVLGEIAMHVADLAAALVGNIEQPDKPNYAGFQEIEAVPENVAQVFHAVFAERAGLMLEGITRWVRSQQLQQKGRKAKPGQPMRRIGLGVYFLDEPAGVDRAKLPAPPLERKSRRTRPVEPVTKPEQT
jgi:hypothetical protein